MPGFRNRLHEQLARRTARDAFRKAGPEAAEVTVRCDVTDVTFTSTDEDDLCTQLEAHYKSAEYRMATQLPMHQQRSGN